MDLSDAFNLVAIYLACMCVCVCVVERGGYTIIDRNNVFVCI